MKNCNLQNISDAMYKLVAISKFLQVFSRLSLVRTKKMKLETLMIYKVFSSNLF